MIKRIDAASARKISAGQVITDLASVMKELLENSLDAGARTVTIRLCNYGLIRIVVEDDGHGIPMAEVLDRSNPSTIAKEASTPLLISRATTKLGRAQGSSPEVVANLEQRDSRCNLGFRGEALHSLAQVSNVTIETMHQSYSPCAVRIEYDNKAHRVQLSASETPQSVGTIVKAEGLFENFPVRYKEFSRNRRKQLLQATNMLKQYAVSHPELRLIVTHQESPESAIMTLISLTASKDLLRSATEAYGGMCLSRMIPIHWACSFGNIHGYVSKVGSGGRMSSDHQIFSLDHRPVDLPRLSKAINDTFSECLPNASQKLCVEFFLQISMKDSWKYDVNLAPNKRKVIIANEDQMAEEIREIALKDFRTASEAMEIKREVRMAHNHIADLQSTQATRQVLTPVSSTSFTNFVFNDKAASSELVRCNESHFRLELSSIEPFLYSNTNNTNFLKPQSTAASGSDNPASSLSISDQNESENVSIADESCSSRLSIQKEHIRGTDGVDPRIGESDEIELYESPPQAKCRRLEADNVADVSKKDVCIILSDNTNQSRERGPITTCVNFPCWESLSRTALIPGMVKTSNQDMLIDGKAFKPQRNGFSSFQEQTSDELEMHFHKNSFNKLKIIGQFNHGFILATLGSDLFVIDQHASDEKYNYERLMRTYVAKPQPLVVPVPVPMDAEEVELALQRVEDLKLHGFQVKPGDCATKLLVCSIPVLPYDTVSAADIVELVQQLVQYGSIKQPLRAMWHSMATKACRTSIMIGTVLSESTMRTVVNRLSEIEQPWTCPHGRPTLRHLSNIHSLKTCTLKPFV